MTIPHSNTEVAMPDPHQKSSLCQLCIGRENSFILQGESVQFSA